jgi:23S rRNA (pseudouridine1915-N3)-methyltransferase
MATPDILILSIGKMKRGELAERIAEYQKRLSWKIEIKEIDLRDSNPARLQERESEALLEAAPEGSFKIVLDERGKELLSRDFAANMQKWRQDRPKPLVFMIGGAAGHSDLVRKKADFLLSFGKMTWPHLMVRVMLMEQLYRASTIIAGHPYHRE